MMSGRRTFRDLSPSPIKKKAATPPGTPSKRTRFLSLLQDDSNTDVTVKLEEVKAAFSDINHKEILQTDILLKCLVVQYGLLTMNRLIGATHHVPTGFPNRVTLIRNIVNVNNSCPLTEEKIVELMPLLNGINKTFPSEVQIHDSILWECSYQNNEGYLRFVEPPVQKCVCCGHHLYNTETTQITIFSLNGPLPATKVTKRCTHGCGAYFNLDRYSIPNQGIRFYEGQEYISASRKIYMTKEVHELICESGNHAFVSHHAFAEIYNTVFSRGSSACHLKRWSIMFQQADESDECDDLVDNHDTHSDVDQSNQCADEKGTGSAYQLTLTRKKVMSAYLNGELMNEVQERGAANNLSIKKDQSREDLMKHIDKLRRQEIYNHGVCTPACKDKGCKSLRVIDSCWKVCMPHCMYAVETEAEGMPLLNLPNVCTVEPKANSVFCEKHFHFLVANEIPTKKEEYLKYLGCKGNPSSTDDVKQVDEKSIELSRTLRNKASHERVETVTAVEYQGTADLVAKIKPSKWGNNKTCNKDTGEKSRLRQRSRGHFISVTGGGHIQYFEPIFKSESPSQIFLIVLRVMKLEMSQVPENELEDALEKYVLSYDNMCQLDSLKASKEPLPFPAPFDLMWNKITKIIDRLHIQNHKREICKTVYNPNQIPEDHNTMVAEQTFAWFSRFKKVVNSMTQTHHLFYIHRNIKRRNQYSEKCRLAGKEPLLPGINARLCKK